MSRIPPLCRQETHQTLLRIRSRCSGVRRSHACPTAPERSGEPSPAGASGNVDPSPRAREAPRRSHGVPSHLEITPWSPHTGHAQNISPEQDWSRAWMSPALVQEMRHLRDPRTSHPTTSHGCPTLDGGVRRHDATDSIFASRTTTHSPLACLRRMDNALPFRTTALPPDRGVMRTVSTLQQYPRSPDTYTS